MKVSYIGHCGTDLSVVNAARVSFNKESDWDKIRYKKGSEVLKDKDYNLIRYLAKHNHKSPFNHTFITLHVKAPIFVARQLVKHKFMPWNEVSRRYVDEEPEFYWPDKWRARAEDKKQGSSSNPLNKSYLGSGSENTASPYKCSDGVFYSYKRMLEDGVCPEQARMILPLNTYTEWYWSGTLGAWSDMYNLRSKPDAQKETQEIALSCGEIIKPLFPVSWEALTH